MIDLWGLGLTGPAAHCLAQVARVAPPSSKSFSLETVMPFLGYSVVLFAMGLAYWWFVGRLRDVKDDDQAANTHGLLSELRKWKESGQLTPEEYRKIKSKLGAKLKSELKLDKSAKTATKPVDEPEPEPEEDENQEESPEALSADERKLDETIDDDVTGDHWRGHAAHVPRDLEQTIEESVDDNDAPAKADSGSTDSPDVSSDDQPPSTT